MTKTIDITFGPNATNHWLFYMNGVSSRVDYKFESRVPCQLSSR